MSILPEAAKQYVGLETEVELACDVVECGAVRRYAQAIMDEDPVFAGGGVALQRFGAAVAPLLFPTHMFRRGFGEPDPLKEGETNPDFDGSGLSSTQGLPAIEPLKHLAILNGGSDIEFYRHAHHGEQVRLRSRYASISEKQSSKGPMVIVIIESDYLNGDDELLCRVRRTYIRR
jgi:hypothetical protein